jgi:hypothetical protein
MPPRHLFIALIALLSFQTGALAQASAALWGKITDPSGGVISGAEIQVKSDDTGEVRKGTTNRAGLYRVPAIPVGVYEIRVRKSNFEDAVRTGIHLAVGQEAEVDIEMQIGAANEQVTIHGDVPLVGVNTSVVTGLVGEREIRDLPLNGRSYDELLTLNPGVVNFTSQKTGGVGVSNSSAGNNFAVSGNRPQQNLYLLNGIEFTGAAENNMQPGGVSQELLGVDAVREFNVLRDTYGAKYGLHPGAQVLIITQSGSNEVHGSVYEFLRNNDFDARNFFDGLTVPGFQRNQFGASLGGPLKKDKAFLFGNFEELLQHLHQTGVDLVPDNDARAGFLPCKLVKAATPCPASGLEFVGISPWVNAWPEPTPGAPDFGGISEAFNNPLQTIRDDFGTLRMDQLVSAKDSMSAVYTVDDSADVTPTSTNLYSTDLTSLREQVASVEETHTFSAELLNTFRAGYSRASYFFTGEPTPGTPAASLPGFLAGDPVGAIVVGGSAASNPTAQLSLAGSNNGSNLRVFRNLFTYEDNVSLTEGKHQLDFGVWLQRLQSNEMLALSQYGQATFSSLQTFLQDSASSLLFDPSPTEMHWRSLFGAWYMEDVIRANPRLAISLGFRAESTSGWNDAHGEAANYTYPNGIISTQPRISSEAFTVNEGKFLPQPRVAVAWSPPGGAGVIRAGFGLYNDLQDALGYRMDQNAPFNPTYSISNFNVAELPIERGAMLPAGALLVPGGVQPDMRTPTLISWSLRLEKELLPGTEFTAGYVGSHGYHELIGIDANEPFPVVCPASPCPARYPSNFAEPLAGAPVAAGTYYVPSAVKANPALGGTWTYFSEGDNSYHALELEVERRFESGLALRGAFTWSKAIDDGDSPNATTSGGEPALASNPFDLAADRGLANFNVTGAGTADVIYNLPLGRGKRFLGNASGWGQALASGWMVGSILTLQSGFPFTPQLSYNPSNNGDTHNPVRPYVNPLFTGPVITGKVNEWFNPAAFLAPPNGSGFYGNLGRDTLIGPGLATWDFSLLKSTAVREGMNLQFRFEFFNLLNRANFNVPNAVVFTPTGVSPTAGVITSTATTSRQIQLGAKLLW